MTLLHPGTHGSLVSRNGPPCRSKTERVQQYFAAIAEGYDCADAVLSWGLHRWWRRRMLRGLSRQSRGRVLDLCGGTGVLGDMAAKGGSPTVVVCDRSRPMLETGRRRRRSAEIAWVEGDAESLGLKSACFDVVLVGYGLRNLARRHRGLQEAHRVLRPGGRLRILEFSVPGSRRLRRIWRVYFFHILPVLGRWITGSGAPFRYLAESVAAFPPPHAVAESLREAGFGAVGHAPLSGGLVTVYGARKPTGSEPPASAVGKGSDFPRP